MHPGGGINIRDRQLNVDDEEELLMLQEEMRAKREAPAAKVTRITRPSTTSPTPPPPPQQQQPPSINEDEPTPTASQPTIIYNPMNTIMGQVTLRDDTTTTTAPDQPPSIPSTSESSRAPFPVATHRKLSKFALGRRNKQQPTAASTQPIDTSTEALISETSTNTSGNNNSGSINDAKQDEQQDEIDMENTQVLESMTAEQIEEARADLLSRLPASTVEFLKTRGASKKHQPQTTTATTTSKLKPKTRNQPSTTSTAQKQKQQQSTNLHKAAIDTVSRLRFDLSGQPISLIPLNTNTSTTTSTTATAANNQQQQPSQERDISSVLTALNRDPLRVEEAGTAGQGYTIKEACQLVRSSVVQQRVVGLRLLTCILTDCHPWHTGSDSSGGNGGGIKGTDTSSNSIYYSMSTTTTETATETKPGGEKTEKDDDDGDMDNNRKEQKIMEQQEQQKQENTSSIRVGLKSDVWFYALHEATIVYVLRHALDDVHAAVVTAASTAILALLGGGIGSTNSIDTIVWEIMGSAPCIGLPLVPLRHMQRQNSTLPWITTPANPTNKNTDNSDDDDDDVDFDEKELAKVDPLGGLLHMSLPERITHILSTTGSSSSSGTAVVVPLLEVSIRLCMGGSDVVDRILAVPKFIDTLKSILLDINHSTGTTGSSGTGTTGSSGTGTTTSGPTSSSSSNEAAVGYKVAVRLAALRLLTALVAGGSAHAARVIKESGILLCTYQPLLQPFQPSKTSSSTRNNNNNLKIEMMALSVRIEALKIWRCMVLQGHFLLPMDDVYPAVCGYMTPSPPPPPITPANDTNTNSVILLQWKVAREVFLTATQICHRQTTSSANEQQAMLQPLPSMSRSCGEAIATQTLAWLHRTVLPTTLSTINNTTITTSTAINAAAAADDDDDEVSVVVLSTMSAAVSFLAAFYSTQQQQPSSKISKEDVIKQLQQAGILLPPSSSGTTADSSSLVYICRKLGDALFTPTATTTTSMRQLQAMSVVGGLAVALTHLESTLTSPFTTDTTDTKTTAKAPTTPTTASYVLQPYISLPSQQWLKHHITIMNDTLLQPWDSTVLSTLSLYSRTLTVICTISTTNNNTTSTNNNDGGASSNNSSSSVDVVMAALHALRAVPPGEESTALKLLSFALLPSTVRNVLDNAKKAAADYIDFSNTTTMQPLLLPTNNHNSTDTTTTASIDTVGGGSTEVDGGGERGEWVSILSILPDSSTVSKILLAGYAATWLGLVQHNDGIGTVGRKNDVVVCGGTEEILLRPAGSLLPLPLTWTTHYSITILNTTDTPPNTTSTTGEECTAAALLYTLGLEYYYHQHHQQLHTNNKDTSDTTTTTTSSTSINESLKLLTTTTAVEAAIKLKSVIKLVFLPEETVPLHTIITNTTRDGGMGDELWMDRTVRLATAALITHYCGSTTSIDSGTTATNTEVLQQQQQQQQQALWSVPEAKRLTSQFAATSFGDSLFGAAVAAALLRFPLPSPPHLLYTTDSSNSTSGTSNNEVYAKLVAAVEEVQIDVLQTLADEKALHLLPPLELCLGPKTAYLSLLPLLPPSLPASQQQQHPPLAPPPPPQEQQQQQPSVVLSRASLTCFLKLLSDGALWRSVENKSMVVDIIIHKLASYIFNTTTDSSSDKARQAVLCSVIRRCYSKKTTNSASTSSSTTSSGGVVFLSMLLRWDVEAMEATDVVSRERMQWIETAVKGQQEQHNSGDGSTGEDKAESMMSIVMTALHTG